MERKLQEEEGPREKAVGRIAAMPRHQIEELILGCVCFVGGFCVWGWGAWGGLCLCGEGPQGELRRVARRRGDDETWRR